MEETSYSVCDTNQTIRHHDYPGGCNAMSNILFWIEHEPIQDKLDPNEHLYFILDPTQPRSQVRPLTVLRFD